MPPHDADEQKSAAAAVSRQTVAVLALLLMAAGLRSTVMMLQRQQLARDPDGYRLVTENLCQRGVYALKPGELTALRPPLYPLLLAVFARQGEVSSPTVGLLHVILGVVTVWLTWTLARKWGLQRLSYLAAAFVACDPILLKQSTEVMTETLATLLTLLALLALTELGATRSARASLLAGILLGLATLCRPTFMVWTALIVLWILMTWERRLGYSRVAILLVAFLVVLAPWAIRNQRAIGRPVLTTTHGGYTLLLGNNASFYKYLRGHASGSVWDARELLPLLESATIPTDSSSISVQGLSNAPRPGDPTVGSRVTEEVGSAPARMAHADHPEVVRDRQYYGLAREAIAREPGMFAFACGVRVLRLWTPLPHRLSASESWRRRLVRWMIALWYTGVFVAALIGLWCLGRRLWGSPWIWAVLCVLAVMAIHTVYWSNMRMRAPVMPVVYLACSVGMLRICERLSGRK